MLADSTIDDLQERARQRLADDIRRQQALLDDLRARTAQAQRELTAIEHEQLEELTRDFDAQVAALSPWWRESRAGLLRRLRSQLPELAQRGEQIDLARACKHAPIER
jgi:hypothetical protein